MTDEKFEKLLKFQYKMFREGQTNYLTQVYTISKGKYILYMCCTYLAISCSSEGTVLSQLPKQIMIKKNSFLNILYLIKFIITFFFVPKC